MQFGGTVLYFDAVSPVVDFYRRVFGLELRFFDESLGFAELETGGSTLAIAAQLLTGLVLGERHDPHPERRIDAGELLDPDRGLVFHKRVPGDALPGFVDKVFPQLLVVLGAIRDYSHEQREHGRVMDDSVPCFRFRILAVPAC